MQITKNQLNRFEIDGISDPRVTNRNGSEKSGISGYHGRLQGILGWISAKILHKSVPINTNKGVYYLNCKSLEKWCKRVDPAIAQDKNLSKKTHNPLNVEDIIHKIHNKQSKKTFKQFGDESKRKVVVGSEGPVSTTTKKIEERTPQHPLLENENQVVFANSFLEQMEPQINTLKATSEALLQKENSISNKDLEIIAKLKNIQVSLNQQANAAILLKEALLATRKPHFESLDEINLTRQEVLRRLIELQSFLGDRDRAGENFYKIRNQLNQIQQSQVNLGQRKSKVYEKADFESFGAMSLLRESEMHVKHDVPRLQPLQATCQRLLQNEKARGTKDWDIILRLNICNDALIQYAKEGSLLKQSFEGMEQKRENCSPEELTILYFDLGYCLGGFTRGNYYIGKKLSLIEAELRKIEKAQDMFWQDKRTPKEDLQKDLRELF